MIGLDVFKGALLDWTLSSVPVTAFKGGLLAGTPVVNLL